MSQRFLTGCQSFEFAGSQRASFAEISLRPRSPSLRLALPAYTVHIQWRESLDIPVQGVCPAAVDVEMAALPGQLVQVEFFQRIARRGQPVGGLQDGDPLVLVTLSQSTSSSRLIGMPLQSGCLMSP